MVLCRGPRFVVLYSIILSLENFIPSQPKHQRAPVPLRPVVRPRLPTRDINGRLQKNKPPRSPGESQSIAIAITIQHRSSSRSLSINQKQHTSKAQHRRRHLISSFYRPVPHVAYHAAYPLPHVAHLVAYPPPHVAYLVAQPPQCMYVQFSM